MDSFFLPLVAAAVAEWGDKTQILAVLLALHYRKPGIILFAIACAAALNASMAAFGGSLLGAYMNGNAAQLFMAVALTLAAIAAFLPFDEPDNGIGWKMGSWKIGTFVASFIGFATIEFGDKTQFLTAGLGAMLPIWPFVAIGAAIGTVISCAPAVMMAEIFREKVPLKLIRRISGGLFLFVAAILAINAFRLI